MNQAITDKQLFDKVFQNLENKGFFAKQDFLCCQSCAWAEIEDDVENIVFYHNQDAENFEGEDLVSTLYLAWRGDTETIINEFTSEGFDVDWDGSQNNRIGIKPRV